MFKLKCFSDWGVFFGGGGWDGEERDEEGGEGRDEGGMGRRGMRGKGMGWEIGGGGRKDINWEIKNEGMKKTINDKKDWMNKWFFFFWEGRKKERNEKIIVDDADCLCLGFDFD